MKGMLDIENHVIDRSIIRNTFFSHMYTSENSLIFLEIRSQNVPAYILTAMWAIFLL